MLSGSNGSHFAAPESNHPNEAGGLPSVRKRDRDDEREEEDGDSQRPIKRREMNHQGQNGGANSDDDGEGSVDGDAEDYHHAGVGIGGAQGSALTEAKVERQVSMPAQYLCVLVAIVFNNWDSGWYPLSSQFVR